MSTSVDQNPSLYKSKVEAVGEMSTEVDISSLIIVLVETVGGMSTKVDRKYLNSLIFVEAVSRMSTGVDRMVHNVILWLKL